MDSEKEKEWKEIQEAVKKADRKAIDGVYIARIELDRYKNPKDKIYCQYCGRKLTKEEKFTHSCEKKPEKKQTQLFKINPDGTTTNIESNDPIKEILSSEECYVIVSDEYRKVYLWKGVNSNVRSKFIGAKRSQDIRGQVGMHFGVVPLDEGDEDPDFIKIIGGRTGGGITPHPYISTPPNPPDDFAMAPQAQTHTPLKEQGHEKEIYCQYCGIKLTKEEEITHSCKKKPE